MDLRILPKILEKLPGGFQRPKSHKAEQFPAARLAIFRKNLFKSFASLLPQQKKTLSFCASMRWNSFSAASASHARMHAYKQE